jgi:hypothetical protein
VAPTDRDVARVLEAAETGVADYPPEFLRRIGLRGLAVTRGLHKARQQLDGVSLSKGYIAVDALFFSRPTTSRSAGLAAPDTVTSSFETGSRERASTSRRCASFSVMTVGAIARAGSPAKRGGSAKQLQTSRALCEVRRAPPFAPTATSPRSCGTTSHAHAVRVCRRVAGPLRVAMQLPEPGDSAASSSPPNWRSQPHLLPVSQGRESRPERRGAEHAPVSALRQKHVTREGGAADWIASPARRSNEHPAQFPLVVPHFPSFRQTSPSQHAFTCAHSTSNRPQTPASRPVRRTQRLELSLILLAHVSPEQQSGSFLHGCPGFEQLVPASIGSETAWLYWHESTWRWDATSPVQAEPGCFTP